MVSWTAHAQVLRTWFSWFRGPVLRLLGFPAALLTLYLEIYGTSPATASFVLHRLSQRLLLLSPPACSSLQRARHDMSSTFYIGGADSMDRVPCSRLQEAKGAESKRSSLSCSSSTAVTASSNNPRTNPPSLPIPRLPMPHSRSKTTSHVDIAKQGKRLSLQFPIQPAAGSTSSAQQSPRTRPQSWVAASPVLSPDADSSEPNILAVLAAQERYVLELKEELNKAEADLKTLKKHYALHEANKRRNDVRKVAQLQPVNTLIDLSPDKEDEDGSNSWMQREMERRKALMSNTKSSQRKVFSGSRHLRTLSLLSPDKSFTPPFPQPNDVQEEEPTTARSEAPARSSTSSEMTRPSVDTINTERYDLGTIPNIQREQIIRAGTQMATDLKNGLFTFIEDIRQATVGDEAVHGPADGTSTPSLTKEALAKATRKAASGRPPLNRSASSKKSSQRTGSIGDDFWKENGLSEPKSAPILNKKTHTNKPTQTPQKQIRKTVDEEEEWDNWETPNDAAKTADMEDSTDESDDDASGPASSRTSTRYHSKRHDSKASSLTTVSSLGHPDDAAPRDSKRNSIPWPDLVKLSPNNLKRTASHLMKEWEKQLTPPPESRNSNHSHGDYIGRSDSPPPSLL